MHVNSLNAREDPGQDLTPRARAILEWMVLYRVSPMTDREIRDGFGPGQDMDYVRPRITELIQAGMLSEVDKVLDAVTAVNVRRTAPTVVGRQFIGTSQPTGVATQ